MHVLLLLLLIGVLYALTQYCIILAYRYADASALSPFNYSVVIFSGILGWLFFGNVPSAGAIVGTVLICAGGIVSIVTGHPEGLDIRRKAAPGCGAGASSVAPFGSLEARRLDGMAVAACIAA